MEVALLISEQQAEEISGIEYAPDSFCNPVKDGLERWIISLGEMYALNLNLEVVEWIPVEQIPIHNEI